MSASALQAPFVLVTGGKGGVGKTTVAANVGVDLAREGKRVLLVDLDLGLANLDVVLGLGVERRIDHALRGEASLRSCIVQGPAGVDVIAGASGDEALAAPGQEVRERLVEMLAEIAPDYDLIIGDSAAGVGTDVLAFASIADRVLVVTSPDLAALTDAYGLIKALDRFGATSDADIPTPEVVVNHASGVEEGKAVARKLRSICERFLARSPRQAGWLPRSVAVERSTSLRAPFALRPKRALENVCLRQIAGRLDGLASVRALAAAPASAPGRGSDAVPIGTGSDSGSRLRMRKIF